MSNLEEAVPATEHAQCSKKELGGGRATEQPTADISAKLEKYASLSEDQLATTFITTADFMVCACACVRVSMCVLSLVFLCNRRH